MYIHELSDWPKFVWSYEVLAKPLAAVRYQQGRLIGRFQNLSTPLKQQAVIETMTEDVVRSSQLGAQVLAQDQVRSAIATRLGIHVLEVNPADREIDGILYMLFDATENFEKKLSIERLYAWHTALFPTGWSVGARRTADQEINQFQAPAANRPDDELRTFLKWFEHGPEMDLILKAGIAHLWFLTLQPFGGGNGRMARAISDLAIVRSEKMSQRFYSLSAQMCSEQNEYFDMLERTQRGTMEITPWLNWFLACFGRAIEKSESTLAGVFHRSRFWEGANALSLNDRQRLILNWMLESTEETVTSSKWATHSGCSQDTAHRDILDLVEKGLLHKETAGGRSTNYSLARLSKDF